MADRFGEGGEGLTAQQGFFQHGEKPASQEGQGCSRGRAVALGQFGGENGGECLAETAEDQTSGTAGGEAAEMMARVCGVGDQPVNRGEAVGRCGGGAGEDLIADGLGVQRKTCLQQGLFGGKVGVKGRAPGVGAVANHLDGDIGPILFGEQGKQRLPQVGDGAGNAAVRLVSQILGFRAERDKRAEDAF